jgi:hypothetical protein
MDANPARVGDTHRFVEPVKEKIRWFIVLAL